MSRTGARSAILRTRNSSGCGGIARTSLIASASLVDCVPKAGSAPRKWFTADEIILQAAAGEKHFTRETVRQVAVRRQPLRMAVLIGAGVGAATGAVAGCAGPDREECADAPIVVGAFGAGLGLAVGALIHKTTIVYPEPEQRTFIVPAISRDAVGVRVSRRW